MTVFAFLRLFSLNSYYSKVKHKTTTSDNFPCVFHVPFLVVSEVSLLHLDCDDKELNGSTTIKQYGCPFGIHFASKHQYIKQTLNMWYKLKQQTWWFNYTNKKIHTRNIKGLIHSFIWHSLSWSLKNHPNCNSSSRKSESYCFINSVTRPSHEQHSKDREMSNSFDRLNDGNRSC